MFLFGFLGILVLTQVYARIFSQRVKVLRTVGFVVCCVMAYWNKPFYQVSEPIRIPIINYLRVDSERCFITPCACARGKVIGCLSAQKSPDPKIQAS